MKKSILICFLLFILYFLIGCATNKLYYWGDYSKTLYSFRKDASDENLLKHKATLENIIEESGNRNLRVPPGVYSELGYIYLRQNNNDTAIKYFDMEAKTYPESRLFMERLTQSAKAKPGQNTVEKKTSEKPDTMTAKTNEKNDTKAEKIEAKPSGKVETVDTKPNKN